MTVSEDTQAEAPVKVQAAVKTIQKAGDLFAVAEGRLIAVRALRYSEHTFDGDTEPTPVAEVAVVDLDGPEPRLLGVVGITWRRVIRQLMSAEADTWQVGVLAESRDSYKAKELDPPGDDVDLEAIAVKLGRFRVASLAEPKQLELPPGETTSTSNTSEDIANDEIPF